MLKVKVRTIDNHLLRVYKKLGLSGRRDLAQAQGIRSAVSPRISTP